MADPVDLPSGVQATLQASMMANHQARMDQAANNLQEYNKTIDAMTLQKYNEKSPSESVGDVKVLDRANAA